MVKICFTLVYPRPSTLSMILCLTYMDFGIGLEYRKSSIHTIMFWIGDQPSFPILLVSTSWLAIDHSEDLIFDLYQSSVENNSLNIPVGWQEWSGFDWGAPGECSDSLCYGFKGGQLDWRTPQHEGRDLSAPLKARIGKGSNHSSPSFFPNTDSYVVSGNFTIG